jgi:hypothetical protein
MLNDFAAGMKNLLPESRCVKLGGLGKQLTLGTNRQAEETGGHQVDP